MRPSTELERAEHELRTTIQNELPSFVEAVKKSLGDKEDILVLHQDAFAADYQESEYRLLGMAIKYAGLHGLTLNIFGRNRETLNQKQQGN